MADTPTPTPTPSTPLIKKVTITPIQQRITAVNEDRTLAFPLHGDLNRVITAIGNVTNYNAETLELVLNALAANGIIVQRLNAIEAAQSAAMKEQALVNSYTDPTVTMTAMTQTNGTVTVSIANHKRIYADAGKTTVNVTGGTITGLALNSQYYVYYDDATRAGGTVTYHYTTDNTVAAQTNGRHSLGGIATGGAEDTTPISGGGVSPPGSSKVNPYKRPNQPNVNIE
jgi:hypothetical protein